VENLDELDLSGLNLHCWPVLMDGTNERMGGWQFSFYIYIYIF
jgi:hypothetical protein